MQQELLGGGDVLGELPDRVGVGVRDRHPLAGQSLRLERDGGVLEDLGVGVLGRAIGGDRVVDPAGDAGGEEPVVRGVVPREDLGRHALVEHRLEELEALPHLARVDEDVLAGLVGLPGAVAEQDGPEEQVRVVAVREGDPGRMALGLQGPRGDARLLPGVGRGEPLLLEEVPAPQHRRHDVEVRHRVPAAVHDRDRQGRRDPAAELLADALGDVAEVHQVLVVERRQDRAHEVDQVVPGAGRELRREPRGQLEMRDAIDPHLDAGLLAPLLDELVEPGVVGGDEVTPLQDPQAGALDLGRRLPGL